MIEDELKEVDDCQCRGTWHILRVEDDIDAREDRFQEHVHLQVHRHEY